MQEPIDANHDWGKEPPSFHPPYVLRDWRTLSFAVGTGGVVILWLFLGFMVLFAGAVDVATFFFPHTIGVRIIYTIMLFCLIGFAWSKMVGYRRFAEEGIVVFNGFKKQSLPYTSVSRVAVQTIVRYMARGGATPLPDTFVIYGPDGKEFTYIWTIDPKREEIIAFVLSCLPDKVRQSLYERSEAVGKPEHEKTVSAEHGALSTDEGEVFGKEEMF